MAGKSLWPASPTRQAIFKGMSFTSKRATRAIPWLCQLCHFRTPTSRLSCLQRSVIVQIVLLPDAKFANHTCILPLTVFAAMMQCSATPDLARRDGQLSALHAAAVAHGPAQHSAWWAKRPYNEHVFTVRWRCRTQLRVLQNQWAQTIYQLACPVPCDCQSRTQGPRLQAVHRQLLLALPDIYAAIFSTAASRCHQPNDLSPITKEGKTRATSKQSTCQVPTKPRTDPPKH